MSQPIYQTERAIIYDIWESADGGEVSDDSSLSERLLSKWICDTRAELIRRQYDNNQSINEDISQVLACQSVIEVPNSECSCETLTDCNILRTELQIPTTVETKQKNLILRVSSPSITNIPFSKITFERAPYSQSSRFAGKEILWFLHNRYIYFISPVFFELASINGVFNYPSELSNYVNSCNGEACWNVGTSYFPVSSILMNGLKLRIQEVNLKMFLTTQEDDKNNADDNANEQQKK